MHYAKAFFKACMHRRRIRVWFFLFVLISLDCFSKVSAAQPWEPNHCFVDIEVVRPLPAAWAIQLASHPFPNWSAGLNSLVSSVAPQIKPVAKDEADKKAGEVKQGGVDNDGSGDLLKHGLIFLCYMLAGIFCTLDFRRRK